MASSDLDLLVNKLAASLKNDNLFIPAMPELVVKLSKLMNAPNLTVKQLANIISSDTGVTSQVVRMSQTMRYSNPGTTITSLPAAISRIGLTSTVSMSLALAIEQTFVFKNEIVKRYCRNKIKKSNQICKYALTICRIRYGNLQNLIYDYVILASALLNIGALPFLVEVDNFFKRQDKGASITEEGLDEAVNKIKFPLGTAILRHWRFDKSFEHVLYLEPDNTEEFFTNSLAFATAFIKYAEENGIALDEPSELEASFAPLNDVEELETISKWMEENRIIS